MSESWASSEHSRRAMQANRSRDTGPELAVRQLLHARGLRYRVDVRPLLTLRRKADIVFTRAQVAVFIDGCFWHGCSEHFVMPKANARYWEGKINRNRQRDAETDLRLAQAGWAALRYWEHEPPAEVAAAIEEAVRVARLRRR
ncbi:very short patch repair endonuclease [Agromyces sp. NPDC049794]|uniref:very short patch repair endonuclease n=1 Tax=unclassified Agromyces TaxID=2639701 RepID=UPI0033FE5311